MQAWKWNFIKFCLFCRAHSASHSLSEYQPVPWAFNQLFPNHLHSSNFRYLFCDFSQKHQFLKTQTLLKHDGIHFQGDKTFSTRSLVTHPAAEVFMTKWSKLQLICWLRRQHKTSTPWRRGVKTCHDFNSHGRNLSSGKLYSTGCHSFSLIFPFWQIQWAHAMPVLHSHKRGFSTSNFKCLLRPTVLTDFGLFTVQRIAFWCQCLHKQNSCRKRMLENPTALPLFYEPHFWPCNIPLGKPTTDYFSGSHFEDNSWSRLLGQWGGC